MGWLRRLSPTGKVLCVAAVFAAGLLAFGAVAYSTLNKIKVNGPLYSQVVLGKDLVADILPPPEYILESYLTSYELSDQKDAEKIAFLQEKFKQLRNDYDIRHEFWLEALAPGEVKTILTETSYQPALAFFSHFEKDFLPAVMAGNLDKAKELLAGPMKANYDSHRGAIDQLVKLVAAENAAVEVAAAATISSRTWLLVSIGLGTFIAASLLSWIVARLLTSETQQTNAILGAISNAQAVIEFNLDGTIRTANENFLKTVGYTLEEIQGKHHRMFCDPDYANSAAYQNFWAKLNRGDSDSGEYTRLAKGGREFRIQAMYASIMDANGKPCKVVKFATDVTALAKERDEAFKLKTVVQDADAALMTIDRNFTVTYANKATFALLNKHLTTMRTAFPSFDPNKLVGANIDQFHKNPSHQRNLLSDPSQLPYKTDIQVGPLTFALNVTAVRNESGEYVGNTLEWKDVTEMRAQERREKKVAAFQEVEVAKLANVLSAVAGGNLTHTYEVAEADSDTTEAYSVYSKIAGAVNGMVTNLRQLVTQLTDNADRLSKTSSTLANTAEQLTAGAQTTTSRSATVAAAAEQMSANMKNMAASTEQMSANVRTVASAAEEMTATINEIAKNAEQSAAVADQAARLAEVSNEKVGGLGIAADEIGKVIEVIQDIAEQTNLLALNATIEAARAGEAGKGFAVVATEVKELAKQTASATDDIRHRIEGIQSSSTEAVDAIRQITSVINSVNEVARTIAAAVEEQSITTRDIAENVAQTATAANTVAQGVNESAAASNEITRNIGGVDQGAKETALAANDTSASGADVARLASELQGMVAQFQV
jgi:methyl-accepting chemotaxis protein